MWVSPHEPWVLVLTSRSPPGAESAETCQLCRGREPVTGRSRGRMGPQSHHTGLELLELVGSLRGCGENCKTVATLPWAPCSLSLPTWAPPFPSKQPLKDPAVLTPLWSGLGTAALIHKTLSVSSLDSQGASCWGKKGLLSSRPAPKSRPRHTPTHLPSGVPGLGPGAAEGGGCPSSGSEVEAEAGPAPSLPLRIRQEGAPPGQLNRLPRRASGRPDLPRVTGGPPGKGSLGRRNLQTSVYQNEARKTFNSHQLKGQLRGLPTPRAAHRPPLPHPHPHPSHSCQVFRELSLIEETSAPDVSPHTNQASGPGSGPGPCPQEQAGQGGTQRLPGPLGSHGWCPHTGGGEPGTLGSGGWGRPYTSDPVGQGTSNCGL